MPKKSKQLFAICHNIRSTHNVGSIFRTADAAGVDKVYLTGYTPTPFPGVRSSEDLTMGDDGRMMIRQKNSKVWGFTPAPPHEKIAKVALGAEKNIPFEVHKSAVRLIKKLKAQGVRIVALENKVKGSRDYSKFNPAFPLALIVGNEVEGVSKNILKLADAIISLPMKGGKESLNVSVAFGIAVYELMKRRF